MTGETLRIGGVPEHFNFPWHLGRRLGMFAEAGIDLRWQDYSTGTGAMVADLADDSLDLAVLLSEGAVAAISGGTALSILGWTVSTPLIWGVHVPPNEPAEELGALIDPRIAISRFGSGSHLMAHVLMRQRSLEERWGGHSFVVVDNLPGAANAFSEGRADLFMWEQFTTQPSVDVGHMRRLDTCPTPWPPFCLCASQRLLESRPELVAALVKTYYQAVSQARSQPDLEQQIADFYQLAPAQVAKWRNLTRWTSDPSIDPAELRSIIDQLASLELARADLTPADCLF